MCPHEGPEGLQPEEDFLWLLPPDGHKMLTMCDAVRNL